MIDADQLQARERRARAAYTRLSTTMLHHKRELFPDGDPAPTGGTDWELEFMQELVRQGMALWHEDGRFVATNPKQDMSSARLRSILDRSAVSTKEHAQLPEPLTVAQAVELGNAVGTALLSVKKSCEDSGAATALLTEQVADTVVPLMREIRDLLRDLVRIGLEEQKKQRPTTEERDTYSMLRKR